MRRAAARPHHLSRALNSQGEFVFLSRWRLSALEAQALDGGGARLAD